MLLTWYFIFLVGVFVPFLALKSAFKLNSGAVAMPPRKRFFVQTIVMLSFIGGFAVFCARNIGLPIFHRYTPTGRDLLLGVAFLVLSIGTLPMRLRMASPARRRRLLAILPDTRSELGLWVLVCLAAGFWEEITYRGTLFMMLRYVSHSAWTAAVVCSLIFAVSHALQGWKSAALIFFFALASHGIVAVTGTLYLMMVLHAVYDLAVGVWFPPAVQQLERELTKAATNQT